MYILIESFITIVLLALISMLWIEARRTAYAPIHVPRGAAIYTVIAVSGSGEGLEQTVNSLAHFLGDAAPGTRIVIEDCGLAPEGVKIAELLARDNKNVVLGTNELIGGEKVWQTT
ncbi:MAG: hypothetical protein LBN00_00235 [Oscillospiraceae bacterium]|jgi:hypothetical protein|nr:hypothetical protein [Oscillospiraceae bacterium]